MIILVDKYYYRLILLEKKGLKSVLVDQYYF